MNLDWNEEEMTMKTCNILCVCGSGTVSSAMVAGKLKEKLKEKGWDAHMVELEYYSG